MNIKLLVGYNIYLFIYYAYENHPMGAMKNKIKKLKEKRKEEELSCSECPTQSFC